MKKNIFTALLIVFILGACEKSNEEDSTNANLVGVTVAGGNGAGSAANQLDKPSDVFMDASGNLYIVDAGNNRIQKWNSATKSGETVAGGNGLGYGANQLNNPQGIFIDGNGTIYIADAGNHRIQKWTPGATNGITIAGRTSLNGPVRGTGSDQVDTPAGVFVDQLGNIYIADEGNNRIQKWAPGATSGSTIAGGLFQPGNAADQLYRPTDVYVDNSGTIYIADYQNCRIQKWASGATSGITIAGQNRPGSAADYLAGPRNLFRDLSGNIYVADIGNHRIQKWAPGAASGTTVAGGNDSGSNSNQLHSPTAVFVDSNGNIYVADSQNHRIQKWAQK